MIPPGPELLIHSRRAIAERLNWPAGAVEACEEIDRLNPGWQCDWWHARDSRPAGFYALHQHHRHLEPHLYGATPSELQVEIMAHRCAR